MYPSLQACTVLQMATKTWLWALCCWPHCNTGLCHSGKPVILQALANLAWSMAHLSYKHEAVLDAIVNRLLSDVDSMNQRDVADLLSALAILKHQPVGEAMDAIVQHTSELLQEPGAMAALLSVCTTPVLNVTTSYPKLDKSPT